LRPALAFIAGIISQKYIEANLFYTGLLFLFTAILLATWFIENFKLALTGALSAFLFVSAGWFLSSIHTSKFSKADLSGYQKVAGIVTSPAKETAKTFAYTIKILVAEKTQLSKPALIKVYFEKSPTTKHFLLDDTVLFKAKLKPVENFTPNFDYKSYMASKSIFYTAYAKNKNTRHHPAKQISLAQRLLFTKDKIKQLIKQSKISAQTQNLVFSILLGDKKELDEETATDFRNAGAMHVLAVSGLHVGIVYLLFDYLLFFLTGIWARRLKWFIIVIAVWFYAVLTGMSDSVFRAALMFSGMAVAKLFERNYNVYNILAISCLISLIINPLSIFNIGFMLSYSAVISIVYLTPKIYRHMKTDIKLVNWFFQLSIVSFSAQIATIPICAHFWGAVPAYGLFSNIIVIPLAIIVFIGGVITIMIQIAGAEWLNFICILFDWLTNMLCSAVHKIGMFPFSVISIKPGVLSIILYYISLLSLAWLYKPKTTSKDKIYVL